MLSEEKPVPDVLQKADSANQRQAEKILQRTLPDAVLQVEQGNPGGAG